MCEVGLRRNLSPAADVPQPDTPALLPSPFGEGLGVRPGAQVPGNMRDVQRKFPAQLPTILVVGQIKIQNFLSHGHNRRLC